MSWFSKLRTVITKTLLVGAMIAFFGMPSTPLFAAVEVLDPVCQGFSPNDPDAPIVCKEKEVTQAPGDNSIYGKNGIINKASRILVIIIAIASVIMIIIGGIRYVLSLGDSSNIQGAKNTILYAIIGLMVALVGQLIIVFVLSKL